MDVLIRCDENGVFYMETNGHDVRTQGGLESAILISLFSEIQDESNPRRGFWGNELLDEGLEFGSKFWLAEGGKVRGDLLDRLISYAEKSLEWMVLENIAEDIRITGLLLENQGAIRLHINIIRGSGIHEEYRYIWRAL